MSKEVGWREWAEAVERSHSASFWLKNTLRLALDRDCVDAACDARELAEILERRRDEVLGR